MISGAERIDKENLTLELDSIYELRSLLEKSTDFQKEVDIINQLSSRIKHLESMVSKIDNLGNNHTKQLNTHLKELQDDLRKAAEEYDDSCRNLQDLIEKQDKAIDNDNGLLSDEEIHSIRLAYLEKKLEENRKSILIKNKMDQIRKKLEDLQEENSLNEADRKEAQFNNVKLNLDDIEFLYFLDTEFIERGLPSLYIVSSSTFDKIQKCIKKRPEKIVTSSIEKLYTPGEVPKDMVMKIELSDEEKKESLGKLGSCVSSIMKKLMPVEKNEKSEYQASNIHVSEFFKNELEEKKYNYDIVYSMPCTGFVSDDTLFQLSSSLIQTVDMKNYATRVRNSIIRNLSEDEVELLLDWYEKLKKEVGDCPMIHNYIFDNNTNE